MGNEIAQYEFISRSFNSTKTVHATIWISLDEKKEVSINSEANTDDLSRRELQSIILQMAIGEVSLEPTGNVINEDD